MYNTSSTFVIIKKHVPQCNSLMCFCVYFQAAVTYIHGCKHNEAPLADREKKSTCSILCNLLNFHNMKVKEMLCFLPCSASTKICEHTHHHHQETRQGEGGDLRYACNSRDMCSHSPALSLHVTFTQPIAKLMRHTARSAIHLNTCDISQKHSET